MTDIPLITIVTPCYNEEMNVEELYLRIKRAITPLEIRYRFNILYIDNSSTDSTAEKLERLAALDKSVKVIINVRNFGHIRSPYYGMLQSTGVATIYLASDLQDPPEMIPKFIESWENGYKLVMGTKPTSRENKILFFLRSSYYKILEKVSEVPIIHNSTGFGLYDGEVIAQLKKIDDPYPFLRGLICELGYEIKEIVFDQPRRLNGLSKNNIYTLYDIAMLGLMSHSKLPLRIASLVGVFFALLSFSISFITLCIKLLFWDSFPIGIAPLVVGFFFMNGILLTCIGILGEYIGIIFGFIHRRPIVVEKRRINFDIKNNG